MGSCWWPACPTPSSTPSTSIESRQWGADPAVTTGRAWPCPQCTTSAATHTHPRRARSRCPRASVGVGEPECPLSLRTAPPAILSATFPPPVPALLTGVRTPPHTQHSAQSLEGQRGGSPPRVLPAVQHCAMGRDSRRERGGAGRGGVAFRALQPLQYSLCGPPR